jgi:hypothetical protein
MDIEIQLATAELTALQKSTSPEPVRVFTRQESEPVSDRQYSEPASDRQQSIESNTSRFNSAPLSPATIKREKEDSYEIIRSSEEEYDLVDLI